MKGHRCEQCSVTWRCNEPECTLDDHCLCDTCYIHKERNRTSNIINPEHGVEAIYPKSPRQKKPLPSTGTTIRETIGKRQTKDDPQMTTG